MVKIKIKLIDKNWKITIEIIIKLKFKKSYLRSTMSQEKLSGLAKLSFEKETLGELEYKKLINNFAPQKQEK